MTSNHYLWGAKTVGKRNNATTRADKQDGYVLNNLQGTLMQAPSTASTSPVLQGVVEVDVYSCSLS